MNRRWFNLFCTLSIAARVKNLDPAHTTHPFLVSTPLTENGPMLMDTALANLTLSSQWIESSRRLVFAQQFISADLRFTRR